MDTPASLLIWLLHASHIIIPLGLYWNFPIPLFTTIHILRTIYYTHEHVHEPRPYANNITMPPHKMNKIYLVFPMVKTMGP